MSKRVKAKQIVLGNPDDGQFGTTNTPNIENTDDPTDAIDKIVTILDLLAPAQSPNLSARSLVIDNLYDGRECSASLTPGVIYTSIIDDETPLAYVDGIFSDGDNGTLTANVNTVADGTVTLTDGDETGTYTSLIIVSDADPYPTAPQAGFWKSLDAQINSASVLVADNTEYNYELVHSTTGSASISFKTDVPLLTPTISLAINALDVKAGYTIIYTSGIPSISANDEITCDYIIDDAVSRFYHSTRVSLIEGNEITDLTVNDPNTIPFPSGVMNITQDVTVLDNVYTEDLEVTFTGFNVKNTPSAGFNVKRTDFSAGERIYVDTLSDESIRVRSGQGLLPAFALTGSANFGEPYTPAISQMEIGTLDVVEELLMVGGVIQYPAGNFLSNYPVPGPNYAGTFGDKYATFNIGSITNQSSVTFRINNGTGINEEPLGSIVTNNMTVQIQVQGQTGWLDANSKYFSGDPSSDGDACYDVAGSPNNGLTRRCTFGTQILTGDVYVRIGLPTGSAKTFTDVELI